MPAVHRVSALVKRWLLGTHQGAVGPEHLDWYLAEWCFRFNRRYSRHRGLLFHNLVGQAATTPPHPYGDLLTKRTGKKFKRETRKQRELRAEGVVGHRRNLPRENPRRPGGARTRLDDDAVRRRRRVVPGRRGRRA
jgi:hypothetical protein